MACACTAIDPATVIKSASSALQKILIRIFITPHFIPLQKSSENLQSLSSCSDGSSVKPYVEEGNDAGVLFLLVVLCQESLKLRW
jgi:hypothetical protein